MQSSIALGNLCADKPSGRRLVCLKHVQLERRQVASCRTSEGPRILLREPFKRREKTR